MSVSATSGSAANATRIHTPRSHRGPRPGYPLRASAWFCAAARLRALSPPDITSHYPGCAGRPSSEPLSVTSSQRIHRARLP